jgi:amino acid transporter
MLVSPSDPSLNLSSTAAKSPFVIAIQVRSYPSRLTHFMLIISFQNAGINALPSIINAALLTSAWSAGCADCYTSSRTLYGLAVRGQAPKILTKTNKNGLPWVCVLVSCVFSLLSFMAAAHGKAGTVFGYCMYSSP